MIYAVLIIFGFALGSFVNALVWRLHEQELVTEQTRSKKRDDYLKDLSITKGRSMCSLCHHPLAAVDLIPVFSWLLLRGKCRYCHRKIEDNPIPELLTVLLFIVSYIFWPSGFHGSGLIDFIVWLALIVGFVALTIYDLRWYLLPNRIVYPLFGLVLAQTIITVLFYHEGLLKLEGLVWGLLIGGGIFYVLYQISAGKWIGGGDVKLGALLGMIVGGPLSSCLLLFVASLAGTIITLPLLAFGRVERKSVIPFGPFLLLAAILTKLFGASLIMWLRQRAFLPPA